VNEKELAPALSNAPLSLAPFDPGVDPRVVTAILALEVVAKLTVLNAELQ
jgi:hypothetical protein